jgi:hypothetical protein
MGLKSSSQSPQVAITKHIGTVIDDVINVSANLASVVASAEGLEVSLKYLGPYSTAPTTRLNGLALEDGDYYFDTNIGAEGITYYVLATTSWFQIDSSSVLNNANLAEAAKDEAILSKTTASLKADEAIASALEASNSEAVAVQAALNSVTAKDLAQAAAVSTASDVTLATAAKDAARIDRNVTDTNATATASDRVSTNADRSIANTRSISATASATTATTQAGIAQTKASEALTSKTNAATSESNANTSATESQASNVESEAWASSTQSPVFPGAPAGTKSAKTLAGETASSAADALTSQQVANSHKTIATTKASEALSSKQAAANSESSASSSKDSAASSASAALSSKSDAYTSEVNALSSKNLAQSAQTGAETAESNAVAVVTGGTAALNSAAGKIPLADADGKIDIDWLATETLAMDSAEFFALAEKRKADNAGSGFSEWGTHDDNISFSNINEGMFARTIGYETTPWSNKLAMGRNNFGTPVGVSKTQHPICVINGVASIANMDITLNTAANLIIDFPPAPDGTETYDSATGALVQHASAAEAFEGDVTNGDFRTGDTTGWEAFQTNSTLSVVDGALQSESSGSGDAPAAALCAEQIYPVGTVLKITLDVVLGVVNTIRYSSSRVGHANSKTIASNLSVGTYEFEYIVDQPSHYVWIEHLNSNVNSIQVDNISILPVTESVITSRQDFVFLESFHEKISDKDVVYPLGNVQYGATSYEGISLANSLVAQGYSAFGEWDTATQGYGVVWSTLSEANKLKFIQDPENNIYSDGGELIQVRYRVRVVKGLGDVWNSSSIGTNPSIERYMGYQDGTAAMFCRPIGKLTSSDDLTISSSANTWYEGTTSGHSENTGEYLIGGSSANVAHNGLCFALPIALVERRNTGAYHPSFNSEGTQGFRNTDGTGTVDWYTSSSRIPLNTADCFNFWDGTTGVATWAESGSIGVDSRRPDLKFYDAIYASDVQDLRMSSKKLPLTEIREKYKRMAIAGDVRGFESVPFLGLVTASGTSSYSSANELRLTHESFGVLSNLPTGKFYKAVGYFTQNGVQWKVNKVYNSGSVVNMTVEDSAYNSGGNQVVTNLCVSFETTHKQANPTWTEICGIPSVIASKFPKGIEGVWNPKSLTETSVPLTRKVTSTFNPNRLRWDGSVWSAFTSSLNSTNNTLYTAVKDNPTHVELLFYTSQAHFTSDSYNSLVLDLGGVYASNHYYPSQGVELASTLIGKVTTDNTNPRFIARDLGNIVLTGSGVMGDSSGEAPTHSTISLGSNGLSPAFKTLDYLSHDNNVAKLCYTYKEMVWDNDADNVVEYIDNDNRSWAKGDTIFTKSLNAVLSYIGGDKSRTYTFADKTLTSDGRIVNATGDDGYSVDFKVWDGNGFGDNNQFEITNNQATQTDDNGNSITYGTASFNTQYFIVEE